MNALNIGYGDHGECFTPEGFSTLTLRGHMPDEPYVACIGGGHVFGRYVDEPWPALLQRPALNLGIGDASPATFLDERLLALINGAERVIVTVMTARNQYQPWQPNEDGLKGCIMKDGRNFNEYWRDVVKEANGCAPKLMNQVWRARNEWTTDMRNLLQSINRPVLVAWISSRSPNYMLNPRNIHKVYGRYPHLVRGGMLPKKTTKIVQSYNKKYYPSQAAHRRIAARLRALLAKSI